jgi:uncharacterized membrane protein
MNFLKNKTKETRPKLDLPVTVMDRMLESAAWSALLILWGLAVFFYLRLPETIPTHFNIHGEADDWGGKAFLFFLPVLATVILTGITLLQRVPHIFNYPVKITPQNAARQYVYAVRMLRFLKISMTLIFIMITIAIYLSALTGSAKTTFMLVPAIFLFTFLPIVFYFIASFRRR